MFDIIGHIGGNAPALERLLTSLGYRIPSPLDASTSSLASTSRRLIFLGRLAGGPGSARCYQLARSLVDAGVATWVMTPDELCTVQGQSSEPPIEQSPVSLDQHCWRSLLPPEEFDHAADWFETLPLWIQLPGLRAVHGTWDDERMQLLATRAPGRRLIADLFTDDSPRGEVMREALALCTGAMMTAAAPLNPSRAASSRPVSSPPLFTAHPLKKLETRIDLHTNSCSLGPIGGHSRSVWCYRWSGEKNLLASHLMEVS